MERDKTDIKKRIVFHYMNLLRTVGNAYGIFSKISKLMLTENIVVDRFYVRRTISTFNSSGKLYRDRKGRPKRLSGNHFVRSFIDSEMKKNDETTAKKLQFDLQLRGYQVSISTINLIRRNLGWTLKGTRYCQLIRDINKPKRVQWAEENIGDSFEDVVWTDETSVWLEQHAKRSYRKKGFTSKRKPKPKYPLKIHLWAGVSKRGKTEVCIFKGIMDADLYIDILRRTLIPFIRRVYPEQHRFMQDNDPKHRSVKAKNFFEENNINWWKTPAESPDLNPIENLWHELKDFLRRNIKPMNEQELIEGIQTFWDGLTPERCSRYINHVQRVIPEVIKVDGKATGY